MQADPPHFQCTQEKTVVVVGPTASGKSEFAQEVAAAIGGEVISADSMQIYRGMDIGTGKLLSKDRKVTHHGIDIIDPGQPFSAALFQDYGRKVLDNLLQRNIPAVVCGGTGFYIRALIDDFDFPPGDQVGNEVRDEYSKLLGEVGSHGLWLELQKTDPESAAIIHENDAKRVIRAFELLAAGTSYKEQKQAFSKIPQRYPAVFIGLAVEPGILNQRIDNRVDGMLENGLVDEVNTLLKAGFRAGLTSRQAIGYKEIVAYLDGDCTLDEAVARIKTATHRYAKRQRTWFGKDLRIHWLDANSYDVRRLTNQALSLIDAQNAAGGNPACTRRKDDHEA